jgi:serine/threonine protein kinase
MKAERWQEIETVLQDALDRPPLERASFIENVCAGDAELKTEATTLIAAYEQAGDFIEQPAIAQDAHVLLTAVSGREIGPYRIIEQLGVGGMGEVYLAQDTRLSRLVALKLLPAYFASDDARLRRFQSEARAASALNHPNILTIYEVGEHDGVYFIATEFIDGKTLAELMRNEELSLGEVLDCVEQVGSALAVAHAAGIVHRDIKPENIMRRHDGLLKILDFGIAKLLEPAKLPAHDTRGGATHTEAGLVLGTVNYMSPEQARALPVDERTDIWSVGVVLYELVTRRLPFHGATRMDTIVAILDRQPAPLGAIADENARWASLLQPVIDRCLCKEIGGRYGSVGELLEDLKRVRDQFDAEPAPPEQARSSWKLQKLLSSRLASVAVGVVLLLAIALVGVLLYRRSVRSGETSAAITAPVVKPYAQMNESERFDFIAAQEQRIASMMGERPVKLDAAAVRIIKAHVDRNAGRLVGPPDQESGSMIGTYERARPYVPLISRSFTARKVPVIIGIYLPVIESAYRSCYESPVGAKGLYQFLPATARNYGVSREEMCDAEKMTPAAAHYIADRMAELGEDSQSVTLVLISYNRGAEWVRDTLRQLRGTDNYARDFWTLLAHSDQLDDSFRNETAHYVPAFFAAAIIGENPEVFGLKMPPLSTLATP